MDGVHGFDVGVNPKATSDTTAKTLPFVAATFPYDPLKNKKLIDLGCTATFKGGYKEMSKVFGELTNLKIEKKPYEEGGNCIDFTQDVLVHLAKDKKNIPDVPDKFKALRKERYDKVRAAVFKGLY
ncbi:hypothetical protein BT96DRAFT_988850 [Gymnopus androsaceus JB14]|uniref:Uncharacterized protein n=1 Tax=Gymnopus androsaceus JB14 TaxID=1447944 RepID=A0A6A4I893_9AGAR|nr:hypothetical protein BT96DRAFT_988850 [Gymnopus androsaceus JB14]